MERQAMSKAIRRLEMSELDPRIQQALEPKVKRLGYLGEFFRCTGHQPEVLLAFNTMTESLKEALPDRLTELVAITVTLKTGNDYERHQHEQLSVKLGLGREWVAAVSRLQPLHGSELEEDERAVQRLTLAMLAHNGKGVRNELKDVVELIGQERAIAVLMSVGRYMVHGLVVNALELAPPVSSIFEQAAQ
jgi:alkylhydroperoxidase family enzyme